jgi:4-hydroxybenzoyl-CoA thioesterase
LIRHELEVTFADADPAGIAYYPRILDYCHRAFETFFAHGVGETYAKTFLREGIGFPTVALQAEFREPMRFGERIGVDVSVQALSSRSVTFEYRFTRLPEEALCATVRNVAVAVDRQSFRPIEIPERYAAAFRRHRA